MVFIILTIIAITVGALPDNPLQIKYLALLVAGFIAIAKIYQERYFPVAVVAAFMLINILKPEGMNAISLIQYGYIACFLGLAYFARRIPHSLIQKTICWVAILQALYGIMQVWYDPLFSVLPAYITANPPNAYRIFGTFGNRQYWLMFLAASVPLFFHKAFSSRFKFLGIGTLTVAYLCYLSLARTITFVEVIAIMILCWYLARQNIVFFIPVIATLAVFTLVSIWGHYRDTPLVTHLARSLQMRVKTATMTKEIMDYDRKSYFLGYGLGTFGIVMPAYESQKLAPERITDDKEFLTHAHNEYLQAWFELGLPGVILLLVCFFYIALRAYGSWDYTGWWFSLLFIGLFSWVHFPLHLPQMAIFFLRGKDKRKQDGYCGFYSGCPDNYNKLGRSK